MQSYTIVEDKALVRAASQSAHGRKFWTGGRLDDALEHLLEHPSDVCMVRNLDKIVLLGGPIPQGTLVDVTDENFSDIADSFDVGEMTSLTEQWFRQVHDKQVTVNILESGVTINGLSPVSQLISLSRKTPALLDMAATETGEVIGQYNSRVLGHSGDLNSTIGGVNCLHHQLGIKPEIALGIKLYFLAGYNNRPLKAWRDSRVFWIVYDPNQELCWLVPHDLSHHAVGDTVSSTMPLVSKANEDGTISVMHLPSPVQASLNNASPLNPAQKTTHQQFVSQCMDAAYAIDWTGTPEEEMTSMPTDMEIDSANGSGENMADAPTGAEATTAGKKLAIDRTVAIFDGVSDTLFQSFPKTEIGGKLSNPLSPMYGPLKVLASGCCANSRVVVMDGSATCATSEVNSVSKSLSGVIFVKTALPDIYKLNQTRWNMARAPRTPVLALTPDGCKFLCGPMPPNYQDEECPTPMAGSAISPETVQEIVEFSLSSDGDDYFGPLYQEVPTHKDAEEAIASFIHDMQAKDFSSIDNEPEEDEAEPENAFVDDDFRRLMEAINILSASTATAVERNNHAVRLVKFLRKKSKQTANDEIESDRALQRHVSSLDILSEWNGENLDWAVDKKEILEDLLKGSNVKIEPQKGVEVDLALQTKLDEAVKTKRSQLRKTIKTIKTSKAAAWKKIFNAVFQPPLEALMRSIGENPRYRNFFAELKNNNMSGVIVRATQSTAKQSVATNPEDVMKIFHKLGATGFVRFTIRFLQTWKTKAINEICVVDRPGQGFNDPQSYVPVSHRLEDGPGDPVEAYETDVRHQFVLPTFKRLPKIDNDDDEEEEDDEDEGAYKAMPEAPMEEDLAEYLLMRKEFILRDPEQGPRQPMWQYVDWLFHQIKVIHQVHEKQAAPLAMRALGFSIARLMKEKPEPDKETMEVVASIIQAINFMSARGDPLPHGCIDTLFSMGTTYVPQTKDMERSPWQIEVINILSRAIDYIVPIMPAEEYVQIRSNFQRAAANMVKRQIVQKLLDDVREELKKKSESQEDYVARVNSEFYPAYREVVDTIKLLIDADPTTFQLTEELRERIQVLHQVIVVDWSKSMRRCRVGPVREMVKALKAFSERGGQEAMEYLVDRKPYLETLYDIVFHIKYESCDQVLVREVCNIIRARPRNPEHEKHEKWQTRVDQAIEDISSYDTKMSGFSHGNQYKQLPTELMLRMLHSLKADPVSNNAVTFEDVKSLLRHVGVEVEKPADLKVQQGSPDGRKSVFEQLRGAWWMCPEIASEAKAAAEKEPVPTVDLIPMSVPNTGLPASSNILAILGDTYHKFKLARLYSGNLQPMRSFIRENYMFHLEWFEETIRAAGLPQHFDPSLVQNNETMAIYAVVQRLVHELVEDESDRGDRARDRVYGEVLAPHSQHTLEDSPPP